MKEFIKFLPILSFLALLYNCNQVASEQVEAGKRPFVAKAETVDTIILKLAVFNKELVSNGKLKANRKSELRFNVNGQLNSIKVKNGQEISKGDIIASIEPFQYQQNLEQAKINVRRTYLELQNMLVGQGYDLKNDSASIPASVYENMAIRSGYLVALKDLKTAEYNLNHSILKAPFKGKIADLRYKEFDHISSVEAFCTLIDDSVFDVEFSIIESEIKDIALLEKAMVKPFALDRGFTGIISEINPLVNEKGLVTVKAEIANPGMLMEGMNAEVLIQKEAPDKLIVPKSAVVLRQNQEVLFKYVNGKAFWTYVKIELENSNSYAVIAEPTKGGVLNPGDTIVVSGNLNLAHESEVRIISY